MSALRPLILALRVAISICAVIVFGAGVPFLWIWVGSQLQGGTAPSLAGLGVALLGIVLTYALLVTIFAWAKEKINPSAEPVRHEWNRSLSAERKEGPSETSSIEDVAAAATLVVAVVCTIWFLLFGDPGVRQAP